MDHSSFFVTNLSSYRHSIEYVPQNDADDYVVLQIKNYTLSVIIAVEIVRRRARILWTCFRRGIGVSLVRFDLCFLLSGTGIRYRSFRFFGCWFHIQFRFGLRCLLIFQVIMICW